MSLLGNLFTQVKGLLHDAQEGSEDIGSIARQTVREIEDDIQKLEEAQVGIKAEHLLLLSKVTKADDNVDKYTNYANKAVAAGNDALALDAINDKNKYLAERTQLQAQVDKFAPAVRSVDEKIAKLNQRKEQMARDAAMLEGRANVAAAEDRVATVLGGIGNGQSASDKFNKLEERLQHKEAVAQAKVEMANAKDGTTQAEKYAELDAAGPNAAADELAAMKAAAMKGGRE